MVHGNVLRILSILRHMRVLKLCHCGSLFKTICRRDVRYCYHFTSVTCGTLIFNTLFLQRYAVFVVTKNVLKIPCLKIFTVQLLLFSCKVFITSSPYLDITYSSVCFGAGWGWNFGEDIEMKPSWKEKWKIGSHLLSVWLSIMQVLKKRLILLPLVYRI